MNTLHPSEVRTENKLARILSELEEQAQSAGAPKYRTLRNGLVLRVTAQGGGFECAIARKSPTRPSEVEERTVLEALGPLLFAGSWHHYERRRAIDGAYYHVSVIDYHR